MRIFDGHNDALNKISESSHPGQTRAFLEEGPGHLDLPRALQGGMVGGFFAVYPSDPPSLPSDEERTALYADGYEVSLAPALEYDYALQAALGMIDLLERIAADSEGEFEIVKDRGQLQDCLARNVFAAVLHLEGAEPIQPDLENLDWLYQKGLRSLGITWSRPNAFGFGVPFKYPSSPDTGPGLTDAGRDLVRGCNQLGVLIDLAHLTEKGFWDVAGLSAAPLVSSHTAAWALIPKARNLTDDQLTAIGESGGLAGVIFSVNDLDGGIRPKDDAPIQAIIRHMCYIAGLIGPEHLAFGSDFDGTTIPTQLGDVSNYQKLVLLLREAGFSPTDLENICIRNWLRVLESTWKQPAGSGPASRP